ncbi:hypothetical protein FTRO_0030070 [Fructobacillus tropaeoli]|uniref:Uncharacterized protein n=1 Tax=Fructobacillus tropaeoli TaxID=709323 RepID=A0A3F3H221_9LACO|nr:hypothetical protein FTRO_0030070 [Fructobacillus tropaeoli]
MPAVKKNDKVSEYGITKKGTHVNNTSVSTKVSFATSGLVNFLANFQIKYVPKSTIATLAIFSAYIKYSNDGRPNKWK